MSREVKIGIVTGIISSILVIIFIQPILSFIWVLVLSFGEYVHAGYVDSIYREAALGSINSIGQNSILSFLLLTLFVMMYSHSKLYNLFPAVNNVKRERFRNLYFGVNFLVISILSFMLLIISSITIGVMEISASYNQRLSILAPDIDEHEYKVWVSQWASMKGRSDYRLLVSSMENVL
jgi:hypothetical protein